VYDYQVPAMIVPATVYKVPASRDTIILHVLDNRYGYRTTRCQLPSVLQLGAGYQVNTTTVCAGWLASACFSYHV
jgi:hypothetical protein